MSEELLTEHLTCGLPSWICFFKLKANIFLPSVQETYCKSVSFLSSQFVTKHKKLLNLVAECDNSKFR